MSTPFAQVRLARRDVVCVVPRRESARKLPAIAFNLFQQLCIAKSLFYRQYSIYWVVSTASADGMQQSSWWRGKYGHFCE